MATVAETTINDHNDCPTSRPLVKSERSRRAHETGYRIPRSPLVIRHPHTYPFLRTECPVLYLSCCASLPEIPYCNCPDSAIYCAKVISSLSGVFPPSE